MKKKTHKGASKRFWITGSGKIRHRTAGQDHFNSREGGKTTRNKRKDNTIQANARIKQLLVK
jgi:large subunit ribosomal protein L35